MKNSQGLSFETSSLACQVYYTAKKMSTGFLHCNLDESTRMISWKIVRGIPDGEKMSTCNSNYKFPARNLFSFLWAFTSKIW